MSVIAAILLVFSCLLSGCAGGGSGNEDGVRLLDCPYQLKQIYLYDENTGFGISTDNEVLFTESGIEDFVPVRKIEDIYSLSDSAINASLVDGQTIYVSYLSEADKSIVVEYTTDGGKKWNRTLTTYDEFLGGYDSLGNAYISLGDDKNGYLLYCSSPAAGLMAKFLFATVDGGQSFSFVSDLSSVITGYPQGIACTGKGNAYIAVTYHGEDNYLYRTDDDGATWESRKLDMEKTDISYIDGCTPIFYGEKKQMGTMLLKTVGETITYTICLTGDGGENWTKQKELPVENVSGYTAIEQNKLWFLDAEGNLFETMY
ncbi:MAG: glycoside hydrolase [Ruminococcus sp.]|nr:glycoside hydrolase [Ruminococcus sp.]